MIRDIVCGMDLTSTYGCEVSEFKGITYYFCNGDCRKKFDTNPIKYLNNLLIENESGALGKKTKWERDPVCADMIKIKDARAMSIYKETIYYFCCPICKKEFDKNPSVYADKEEGYYDPKNPNDFLDGRFRIL